jgi:hypothetical protein
VRSGEPPAPLREIVENVAVMEASNRSITEDRAWIAVPEIR